MTSKAPELPEHFAGALKAFATSTEDLTSKKPPALPASALSQRISAVLNAFASSSDGMLGETALMWRSPLTAMAVYGNQYIPERPVDVDRRATQEQQYIPLAKVDTAGAAAAGGGGGFRAWFGQRANSTADPPAPADEGPSGPAPSNGLRPPHDEVLRVTPSLFYAIPSWTYQASSFSFFMWIRVAKFYTQQAVLVSDWAPPSCFQLVVTKERALSLRLRCPSLPAYLLQTPPPTGTLKNVPAIMSTEPLLEAETGPGSLPDDQWHHVGFSYDPRVGRANLYINGRVAAVGKVHDSPARSLPHHLRQQIFLGHSDAEKPGTKDAGCFGYFSDAWFFRGAVPLHELLAR